MTRMQILKSEHMSFENTFAYLPTFENKKSYSHVCEAHITSAKREVPCGRGPGPA